MSNEQHTPGPWKLRKRDDGTGDDEYLGWDWDWDYPHNPPGAMRGLFSKEADARLVEAAPDMLHVLEEVQPIFEAMSMKAEALRFTFEIDGRDTAIEVDLAKVALALQVVIAKARVKT